MIDPKLAGIVAAVAFFLSFLLGVINKTTFSMSLLRAFIFAIIFFGIAAGVELLYKKFLLETDDNSGADDLDGSGYGDNVDISLGDEQPVQGGGGLNDILNADKSGGGNAEVEDVEDLEPADLESAEELETLDGADDVSDVEELEPLDEADSEPLDQNSKVGYHNNGNVISANNINSDLDIGAFVPGLAGLDEVSSLSNSTAPSSRPSGSGAAKTEYDMSSGTVEMTMEKRGDKELGFKVDGKKAAGAIQTLLSKDED